MRWLLVGCAALIVCFGASVAGAQHAEAEAAALRERAEAGDASAIAELLELLHDPDSRVRYHAEWGLANAREPAVRGLIGALRDRPTDEERARAARLLGRVGFVAEPAIPDLRAALSEPDSSTAAAAAIALGRLRAHRAVPDLVRAYTASRKIPNQRKFAGALREIGSDQGVRAARDGLVDSVRADLESGDPAIRAATVAYVWALYRAVVDNAADDFPLKSELRPLIPGLIAALGSPDLGRVEQAIHALTLAGRDAQDALPDLERLIGHPQLHHVAMKAIERLGSAESERVVADQQKREQLDRRIRSGFSVPHHQGYTELLLFRVAGTAEEGLRMSTRFVYPSRRVQVPERVVVHLESTSKRPRFAAVDEIVWHVDGRPLRMRGVDRSLSRSQTNGVIEQVSAVLPVADFLRLARARRLSADAGGVEFALMPDDLAALRYFADQIPVVANAE